MALNRVILMGRISQDFELKKTANDVSTVTFNVAVERNFTKQGEERISDFFTCVAWRQQAEFIANYFAKGKMIAIEGTLRTRNYEDKNGVKRYVTEIFVDNASFTGEPKTADTTIQNNAPNVNKTITDLNDFEEIIHSEDGVPF